MNKGKKNPEKVQGDKYTYFLTSELREFFQLVKVQFCSWLYPDLEECMEMGLQIHLKGGHLTGIPKDSSGLRCLPISIWCPWISKKKGVRGTSLYNCISQKENAAFIFNEACPDEHNIVETSSSAGQYLTFKNGRKFGVLPCNVEVEEGYANLLIQIPSNYDGSTDMYVRICLRPIHSSIAFHVKNYSREIYAYNLNIGQLRNAPQMLPHKGLCFVKDIIVIHIVPSSYNQTFVDKNNFQNRRFLEADKYNKYVKEDSDLLLQRNIKQDELVVTFNKDASKGKALPDNAYAFYSEFERDCVGAKQIWISIAVNIISAAIFAAVCYLFNAQQMRNALAQVYQTECPRKTTGHDESIGK